MQNLAVLLFRKGMSFFSGRGLTRFGPLRSMRSLVLRFYQSRLTPRVARVQGHKMYLDSRDSLLLALSGVHEPTETRLVRDTVKPGDIVLDIGANIGYYTLILAELVGEHGRVFAFEPDPSNFALLKRNVEENGYSNVVLEQKAVSHKTGTIRLHLSPNHMADHRTYDSGDGRAWVDLQSVRLDDYFNDYEGRIDFIKMDVQGAEAGIIEGAHTLLLRNKDVRLIMEYDTALLRAAGADPQSPLRFLHELGFAFYEIDELHATIEPVAIDELSASCQSGVDIGTNLLCIREG